MKKKLIIVLLGALFFGLNISNASAEDEVTKINKNVEWHIITINGKKYNRVYYNDSNNILQSNNPIPLVLIKDENDNYQVSYCLEMIDALIKYDTNNDGETDFYIDEDSGTANQLGVYDYNNLVSTNSSEALKNIKYNEKEYNVEELIELVAYYGKEFYNNQSNNDEKNKYYLAAQRLIWQILADAKVYPGDKDNYYDNIEVNGKIYIKDEAGNELNLTTYENKIIDKIENYYKKPSFLNSKEINEYKINNNNQKYFELDNKNNILNGSTFSSKSECQLNKDKTKIICTDTNKDDKISIELGKNLKNNKNNYYRISDSSMEEINTLKNQHGENFKILTKKNQMLFLATTTPLLKYTSTIKIIPIKEEPPVENVVEPPIENIIPEEPEENPTTSDTNIILIITVCLCALTCAIIMYIRKVKLIKNNTI